VGFADQQVNGAGPAPICTFAGTAAARLTTAAQGDYFGNGSIQHLSHVIQDMLQFFDTDNEMEPPGEDNISASASSTCFTRPASPPATRTRTPTAAPGAAAEPEPHAPAHSHGRPRFRRDGRPWRCQRPQAAVHDLRADRRVFRTLRTSQASLDLQDKYAVSVEDSGLERFLTATRLRNFLVSPRRHRAFPLAELA
jgi:hypothetical protein